jgi:O-antigen/teichoic acid export membrane protein
LPEDAADAADDPGRRSRLAWGRAMLGRASWNLVDQVLSALTNVALTFTVARLVNDADKFGAFSTAMLIFYFMIGIEGALVSSVMGIRHSDTTDAEMSVVAGRGLGAVAVLGAASGLAAVIAGLMIGGVVGPPLIAVGVLMPGLLMQDTCRGIFFAQSRPLLATINDAVWAVVQFSLIGLLAITGFARPWTLVVAWGIAAAVGVVLAMVQLRTVPRPSAFVSWVRQHGDLVGYLLPETLLSSGGLQASTLVTGKIVGISGIGAFGGGQRLLGPLGMVAGAVSSFALPEISRRKNTSARKRWYAAVAVSVLMTVVSLMYVGILVMLPDFIGRELFKASWDGVRSVLLPMGLFSTVAGTCMGPAMVVIAIGQAKRSFRLTLMEFPLILTLMPIGAFMGGAPGAAWGQFVAQAVQVPFWFWTLRKALRQAELEAAQAAGAAEPTEPAEAGGVPQRDVMP